MSKKSSEALSKAFSQKVFAVWLYQNGNSFLLNYFFAFESAMSYVDSITQLKVCGTLLVGETTLRDLTYEEGGDGHETKTKN